MSYKSTHCVYFIKAEDADVVKIGYSASHPDRRFKELYTAAPVALVKLGVLSGDQDREKRLHEKFASHRVTGEWFRYEGPVREFIDKHAKPWPEPEPKPERRRPVGYQPKPKPALLPVRECERCARPFHTTRDRFCLGCRRSVINEMKRAGYIPPDKREIKSPDMG